MMSAFFVLFCFNVQAQSPYHQRSDLVLKILLIDHVNACLALSLCPALF